MYFTLAKVVRTIVICPNCGKNTPDGKFCEHCGASVQTPQMFRQPQDLQTEYGRQSSIVKREKNPVAAALLSFFFTGSGQVYNGQTGKGIGVLIGAVIGYFIFVIPGLLVILYGIYDAYTNAQKMNTGELPYQEGSTATLIGFIIAEIVIVVIAFIFIGELMYELGGYPYY